MYQLPIQTHRAISYNCFIELINNDKLGQRVALQLTKNINNQ